MYVERTTIWWVIFVESPKRPSKLIFVVLKCVTATSPGAWHCTSDDAIDTCTLDLRLVIFFAKPYLRKLGQIAWDKRIVIVLKTLSAGWQWLQLLANTGKYWPRCHDVCGQAHHHGLTVGINFRGWKNFMTAKSTTKIMKISTTWKLSAIRYQAGTRQLWLLWSAWIQCPWSSRSIAFRLSTTVHNLLPIRQSLSQLKLAQTGSAYH